VGAAPVSTPPPIPVPPPAPAREPPVWPVVIAVYSMVAAGYAALGLVGWIIFSFDALYYPTRQALSAGAPVWYAIHHLAHLGRLLLAPLCLAAGLAVYKRHVLGPALHVVWGVPAIILGVAGSFSVMVRLADRLEILRVGDVLYAMAEVSWGLAATVAYPAFVVIWFSRRRVRRQMAAWGAAAPVYSRPVWPSVIAALSLSKAAMHALRVVARASPEIRQLASSYSLLLDYGGSWWTAAWGLAIQGVRLIASLALTIHASLLALLLVPGGIALWRRRRWGATVHLVWAGAAALAVIASLLTDALGEDAFFEPLSSAYWATIRMIYPVFVLIWFTRPRVRRQVAAWGGPERDAALAAPQE